MKIMKLTIKVLKGEECEVEVSEQATVNDVKQEVARKLNIPTEHQRLMSKGKSLADDLKLSECGITDNSKLFISVKPGSSVESVSGDSSSNVSSQSVKLDFWKELQTFYGSHFTEEQSEQLIAGFKQEFSLMTRTLSLDDIERISAAYLSETS